MPLHFDRKFYDDICSISRFSFHVGLKSRLSRPSRYRLVASRSSNFCAKGCGKLPVVDLFIVGFGEVVVFCLDIFCMAICEAAASKASWPVFSTEST